MTTWTEGLPDELVLAPGRVERVALTPVAGGYEWVVESGGDVVQARVERLPPPPRTDPPSSDSPRSDLVLTALAPGTAVVMLALRRPWEQGPPLARHALQIRSSQTSVS